MYYLACYLPYGRPSRLRVTRPSASTDRQQMGHGRDTPTAHRGQALVMQAHYLLGLPARHASVDSARPIDARVARAWSSLYCIT